MLRDFYIVQIFFLNQVLCTFLRLASKGSAKNIGTTMAALEGKVPYMLRFLGNEDDDVSSAVVEFASEYIAMMKTLPSMSEVQKKHIEVRLLIEFSLKVDIF